MDLLIAPHSVSLDKADKVPTTGTPQYATDGSPAKSIPATVFPAAHYNSLMSEICNAILAMGEKLDKDNWSQLATGIQNLKINIIDIINQYFDNITKIGKDANGVYVIINNNQRFTLLTPDNLVPIQQNLDNLWKDKAALNGDFNQQFSASIFVTNASYKFNGGTGNITSSGNELTFSLNNAPYLTLTTSNGLPVTVFYGTTTKFNTWLSVENAVQIDNPTVSDTGALVYSVGGTYKYIVGLNGDAKQLFSIGSAMPDGKTMDKTFIQIDKDVPSTTIHYLQTPGADLAELYLADRSDYKPGTLMSIGGINEVTLCNNPNDFFGVISSHPGVLINGLADPAKKNDPQTFYPIALIGRVPVRIKGPISKGQRITISTEGVAVAKTKTEEIAIGRALKDKVGDEEQLIECFVQASK